MPFLNDFGVPVWASKRKLRKRRYLSGLAYESRTKQNRTVSNRRDRHLVKQTLRAREE